MNDVQFWRDLCPDLTISEEDTFVTPPNVDIENVKDKILNDGYFHVSFDSWDLPLDKMAECIQKIKDLDMHPVWCFVYDEFWMLTTKADSYIKSILGENYHKMPEIWAWHVDPSKKERGWKIHRDGYPNSIFDNGMPKTLTVWIPLTDTDVKNGCMCVVPIANDTHFYNEGEFYYADWQESFYDNSKVMLEAKAGDLLAWNPQLLHWGGAATDKNANPRISISVEFISNNVNDDIFLYEIDKNPWLDPFHIPDLVKKTELINKLILQYRHMWEM